MTKTKSKNFPYISLEKAIDIVTRASKLGKSFSTSSFAGFGLKKGKASSKSGAFARRLAALKYFGLIDKKGDQIELTELTFKIIAPKNDDEKRKAIIESFLNPVLFKQLYDQTLKNVSVKKDDLANIAVREYGITIKAKQRFINSFTSSAEFAELLELTNDKGSIILLEPDKSQEAKEIESKPEQKTIKDWTITLSETNEESEYELEFRSKKRISQELWQSLNKLMEAIEKEFEQKKNTTHQKVNEKENE